MGRPGVSVVVPFLGSPEDAGALLERLAALRTAPGDELIVADNGPGRVVAGIAASAPGSGTAITVIDAAELRSASHARNAGAAVARGEWLLFLDADCLPGPELLDAYFREPVAERCAIVAGEIVGDPEQTGWLAAWARSRRGHWVEHHLSWGRHPSGITANLLVRRSAFEQLGGFGIGGGGDVDLCWRAQDTGWEFAYRSDVVVRHRDRERLRELGGQAIAYGGHQRRLRDLHGPSVPRPKLLSPLARSVGGAIAQTMRGRFEAARFSIVDGLWSLLIRLGWTIRGAGAPKAD